MRRASPYRGENSGPGKDDRESLTPRPGIREHNRCKPDINRQAKTGVSVANDPLRKWSVRRSAPTYALGQYH
jgi:hypothetical protein